MSDAFDDIPVPVAAESAVEVTTVLKDEFDVPVALTCGFIGLGQCGGRLVETFYKIGYRRIVAINTTATDLEKITIPEANKLDLAVGGAGKDLAIAAAAIASRDESVRALLDSAFGENCPDMILLCFGMGGGTGAGIAPKVKEVVDKYIKDCGRTDVKVGAIVALPKTDEGVQPASNAVEAAKWLNAPATALSPIFVLDNDQIVKLYKPSVFNEYKVGNTAIAGLFHTFNKLAAQPAEHTVFDRADLLKVFSRGVTVLGSQAIIKWDTGSAISDALQQSIKSSLLSDINLREAQVSSLLVVCGPDAAESLSASALDAAYTMLSRKIADKSTVYRGIYSGTKPGLTAVFAFGGAPWPTERLTKVIS